MKRMEFVLIMVRLHDYRCQEKSFFYWGLAPSCVIQITPIREIGRYENRNRNYPDSGTCFSRKRDGWSDDRHHHRSVVPNSEQAMIRITMACTGGHIDSPLEG